MKILLTTAILAVKEAGAEIMSHYTSRDFETKTDGSPVTIADTRSNNVLIQHLAKTGIAILSEESNGMPHTLSPYPERMWIIDPLDGTKDFIKKNGDFCVMVGLLEHGKPTLGVVYAPAHETLYYATKGGGSYVEKNGEIKKLTVSTRSTKNLRCIRSVNHFTPRMETVVQKLSATTHPYGSNGIKSGILGEGIGDFFFSWGKLGEWDVCAPEIITREAGGFVTDINGNELFYGTKDHRIKHGMLFSNTTCHEHVRKVIQATPEVAGV